MNFAKKEEIYQRPKLMRSGDLVIVYERHDSLDHFYLKFGGMFNNKFGSFHHNDMIGKPFGSKISSRSSSGWIYLLEPTPELWSNAVHSRTQIVNELDSSFVINMLDVFPGCTVVESGTGSGCMTLSLARAVYPSGKVHTFEFNAVRAVKAAEEFEKLGVGHLIEVRCKDVCGKFNTAAAATAVTVGPTSKTVSAAVCDTTFSSAQPDLNTTTDRRRETVTGIVTDKWDKGNGKEGVESGYQNGDGGDKGGEVERVQAGRKGGFDGVGDSQADAVFLDLPEPWLALDHVVRVLKPGRSVCCYSPCMEQVMKTCERLRELKFHSVRMVEVRQRPFDGRVLDLETVDLGLGPEEEALNNASLRDPSAIGQHYKEGQAGTAGEGVQSRVLGAEDETNSNKKRKVEEGAAGLSASAGEGKDIEEGEQQQQPRHRNSGLTAAESLKRRINNRPKSAVNGSYEMHIARPISTMKGHTAFLTFAVCPLTD